MQQSLPFILGIDVYIWLTEKTEMQDKTRNNNAVLILKKHLIVTWCMIIFVMARLVQEVQGTKISIVHTFLWHVSSSFQYKDFKRGYT